MSSLIKYIASLAAIAAFCIAFSLGLVFGYEAYMQTYETVIKVEGEPDKVIGRFCNPKIDGFLVHVDCGLIADFVYPNGKVQLLHRKKD